MNNFGIPDHIGELSFYLKPENLKLGERLEDIKKLCEINKIKNSLAPIDISFQKFLDEANLSERERDMIYLSQFFHPAHNTLHLTILCNFGDLNQYWANLMYDVYNTLVKYELEKYLLENLTIKEFDKIIKKLKKNKFLV